MVGRGHNLLVLFKGVGHYMQLGTLDDALGEGSTTSSRAGSKQLGVSLV